MAPRTPRFIGSALLAGVLCGASLTYGALWGVPRWSKAFGGALGPVMFAYNGWSFSIGFVVIAVVLVGGSLALSWFRATLDYLLLGMGFVAALVFVALGLPALLVAHIESALGLVMVGLCGLFVAGIFIAALKDRLSRGYRA